MRVYLGLGSNLGDRHARIDEAIERIGAIEGVEVVASSSMHETKPVGGPDQPDFINAACAIETLLTPREILDHARRIEDAMGRTREVHWGPRTIDIDILLADNTVVSDEGLTVPHPRMTEREFVLAPLAEIAPEARHPQKNMSVRELLGDLEDEAGIG